MIKHELKGLAPVMLICALVLCFLAFCTDADASNRQQLEKNLTDIGACQATMIHTKNPDWRIMQSLSDAHISGYVVNGKRNVREQYNAFVARTQLRLKSGVVPQVEIAKYEAWCELMADLNPWARNP